MNIKNNIFTLQNFIGRIIEVLKENAKVACEQSKFMIDDHFTQVYKIIEYLKLLKEKQMYSLTGGANNK